MRFFRHFLMLFLILSGIATLAQDVKVTAKLDTGAMLIGDQVGFSLSVTGPAAMQTLWPGFGDTILGNILVIGRSKIDTLLSADKKTVTLSQKLNLTSFDSGFYTIPQIPVRYRILPDTTVKTSSSNLSMLAVHTVKVDTTVAIKPIKSPLHIPISFREILPYILIALGVILLITGIIWYLVRRKKNKPVIPLRPKIRLQPHEKALQELEKLRTKKLWQQGQVKQFHSELTDILRIYIEERYEIPAMESTTGEILEEMKKAGVAEKSGLEKIGRILSAADMVKFAKSVPMPQENDNSLSAGIEFVRETASLREETGETVRLIERPGNTTT